VRGSLAPAIFALLAAGSAAAQSLVVVEARGVDLKVGSRIEGARPITLPAGGKLVVVRSDGQVISLRGPHNGPLKIQAAPQDGANRALAALVNTRNDRANRVGAVRSGASAAALPSPWLVDITRPGERCIVEGQPIGWWRASSGHAEDFTLFPLDRSWNALLRFDANQSTLSVSKVSDIDVSKAFIIRAQDLEYSIRIHLISAEVTEPAILAGWLIEKGCIQQADALLVAVRQSEFERNGQ
jgi:hypothetical protein